MNLVVHGCVHSVLYLIVIGFIIFSIVAILSDTPGKGKNVMMWLYLFIRIIIFPTIIQAIYQKYGSYKFSTVISVVAGITCLLMTPDESQKRYISTIGYVVFDAMLVVAEVVDWLCAIPRPHFSCKLFSKCLRQRDRGEDNESEAMPAQTREDDVNECPVCYERTECRTPCGHFLCEQCNSRVKKCPICRKSLPRETPSDLV